MSANLVFATLPDLNPYRVLPEAGKILLQVDHFPIQRNVRKMSRKLARRELRQYKKALVGVVYKRIEV